MKPIQILLATAISTLVLAGCGNTAEGMKEDASLNGQKGAAEAQNMAENTVEAGKDVSAAATLTPKIKLAISADKELNDPTNTINVESTSEKVMLEGHVTSAKLKNLAGDIASKVLKESEATQKFENKLEVKP